MAREPSLAFGLSTDSVSFSGETGRATRLSDGRFALVDFGGQTVFLFDSAGTFVGSTGRSGSGPGEYQGPILLQRLHGDTLLIYDVYLRRLTWLDIVSEGTRSLTITPDMAYGGAPVLGQLGDGSLLLHDERPFSDSVSGRMRGSSSFVITDRSGRELSRTPSAIVPVVYDDKGYRFFAAWFSVATDGELIYSGANDRWEVTVSDRTGRVLRRLARAWQPAPVTENHKRLQREAWPRASSAFLSDARFEKTLPAFGTMYPGPGGSVWVSSYTAPRQHTDSVWVFGADGSFLTTIALPSRFAISEIGRDYVLGRQVDAEGLPEVQLYRLEWTNR